MGAISRNERCRKFAQEFGADHVRKFGFGMGTKLVVVGEGLAFDDRDECVRFDVAVRPEDADGEETRFHLDPVFFAPEDVEADQMAQVAEDLEMDIDEVRRRFAKAALSRGRR